MRRSAVAFRLQQIDRLRVLRNEMKRCMGGNGLAQYGREPAWHLGKCVESTVGSRDRYTYASARTAAALHDRECDSKQRQRDREIERDTERLRERQREREGGGGREGDATVAQRESAGWRFKQLRWNA